MKQPQTINEDHLLSLLQAADPDTTIATLVADLRANRWPSPSALAWHYGYKRCDAPAFTNSLYRFFLWQSPRLMTHCQWMRCFFQPEDVEGQHAAP